MKPDALLSWLLSMDPAERDAKVEAWLGISEPPPGPSQPGEHLVGYQPSGVASIVRALIDVPVVASDVLIDLGAGLGKVVLLTKLLTGATARGVELQSALVERARAAASLHRLEVQFAQGDALEADVSDGTVFFLYTPFTGPVMDAMLAKLKREAEKRPIVICALALEFDDTPWLVRRPIESFWLTVYDSVCGPRRAVAASEPRLAGEAAELVAEARR